MWNPRRLLYGILFFCLPVWAQDTAINRYTLFTGFDYMISPARNLTERGFEADFGVTVKPWMALGGDFGAMGSDVLSGAGTINGSETVFVPLLPPGAASQIHVPFKSTTYTFAAGPQFYLRRFEKVTFFARPGLGGIHENADINLSGVAPTLTLLGIPVPASRQTDTQLFFGVGGGFDVNVSHRIGVRFAADWVNTHLFSNLLTQRQNYVRFSVGPTWKWGTFRESK